jgi:hypothetical protein
VIFYDITGFQRRGFLQIISIYHQFPESLILVEKIYRFVYKRIIALPNSPIRPDQRPFFNQGPADEYFRNGESKMNPLKMLTIAGVILFIWCSTAHADRLYTWEDDKGVTHISKEPPPQKTKLIDIMDYREAPASKNQAISKQVSKESESSQPQRMGTQGEGKASQATGTTEDVDEDLYYDGDRNRRREKRENRGESDRSAEKPQRRQPHRRK